MHLWSWPECMSFGCTSARMCFWAIWSESKSNLNPNSACCFMRVAPIAELNWNMKNKMRMSKGVFNCYKAHLNFPYVLLQWPITWTNHSKLHWSKNYEATVLHTKGCNKVHYPESSLSQSWRCLFRLMFSFCIFWHLADLSMQPQYHNAAEFYVSFPSFLKKARKIKM